MFSNETVWLRSFSECLSECSVDFLIIYFPHNLQLLMFRAVQDEFFTWIPKAQLHFCYCCWALEHNIFHAQDMFTNPLIKSEGIYTPAWKSIICWLQRSSLFSQWNMATFSLCLSLSLLPPLLNILQFFCIKQGWSHSKAI